MTETTTELNDRELDALIERIQQAIEHQLALSPEDLRLLLHALLMLAQLQERLADQDITLHKLRKLAGIVQRSEHLKDLVPVTDCESPKKKKRRAAKKPPSAPPVVHERCHHHIEDLKPGQPCPLCEKGKLYPYEPAVSVRISGQSPLKRTEHICERLRCNTCLAYFTAPLPEEVKQDGAEGQRYGYSSRALMGLHKCFAGVPFYRQQSLQQLFGMPVSASSVFDQCEYLANDVQPVVKYLITLAADANGYQLDDTTNRIDNQSTTLKLDRQTGKPKSRSGIYTSGVIATLASGQACVLFQTNIGHAGEWIDEIVVTRAADAAIPTVMSDALSSNQPTRLTEYYKALCNAHARREFVDVLPMFPDKVPWVLERYALIWEYDDHCKAHHDDDQPRLDYHRQHSLPILEELRDWGERQLETGDTEANSGLGKAIGYFLRHFEALSAFCRWPGVPIDNNAMEATLKLIIRGRKNSLFFKTLAGAAISDVLTSLIATSEKAGINTFDYLIVLQRHAEAVKRQPELWLPWNYAQTLAALAPITEPSKNCEEAA
jgi:hypothetical protein